MIVGLTGKPHRAFLEPDRVRYRPDVRVPRFAIDVDEHRVGPAVRRVDHRRNRVGASVGNRERVRGSPTLRCHGCLNVLLDDGAVDVERRRNDALFSLEAKAGQRRRRRRDRYNVRRFALRRRVVG